MQELRFVAVSEDGSYAVLAVPGRSGRFILPIDERLRAVAQGQTTRLAQYEIEVESPLRPKEIQARIRAGETAEEIADAAGIPVERVRWFEGPVLAERAYISDQAQAASVRRAGDSAGPGPRLGDIVPERLSASGADPEDGQWDSRKRGDGNWQVTLTFPSGGRLHIAEWVFDSRRRHVMPDDDNAARLSLPESELPPEPVSLPGEATVTSLAPRLGVAAGMGGGGMGGGGFAGGGSGVGVRSFRPERSVIPDRSLGGDRTLADRPVMPERPAMSHGPAVLPVLPPAVPPVVPPVVPRPTHHDHTAFRDAAPEQPAAPAAVPVTAPAYVFDNLPSRDEGRSGLTPPRPVVFEDPEPTLRDEQPEFASAPAHMAAPAAPPLPPLPAPPPAPPEERLRQPEPASAREFAPGVSSSQPTPQTRPPEPQTPSAQEPTARTASAAEAPVVQAPAVQAPTPAAAQAPAAAPAPATVQAEIRAPAPAAAPVAAAAAAESSARVDPARVDPAVFAVATTAQPAPAASTARPEPTPEPDRTPELAATPDPEAAAAPPAQAESAQAESAQAESAEDQAARQRPGGKKNSKARRSSVPSWDEIMLGSSRPRD